MAPPVGLEPTTSVIPQGRVAKYHYMRGWRPPFAVQNAFYMWSPGLALRFGLIPLRWSGPTVKQKEDHPFGWSSFGSPCWARTNDICDSARACRQISLYARMATALCCAKRFLYVVAGASVAFWVNPSALVRTHGKTKRRPPVWVVFFWLPLLGSNQRHRD